jgi:hypothetical protein
VFSPDRAWLAETEGFEPSVGVYPYGGLANRWFQPLTHVSRIGQERRLYKRPTQGSTAPAMLALAALPAWRQQCSASSSLYLAGTGEIALTSLYSGELIDPEKLPVPMPGSCLTGT